jgi:hypothetical protein
MGVTCSLIDNLRRFLGPTRPNITQAGCGFGHPSSARRGRSASASCACTTLLHGLAASALPPSFRWGS